MSELKASGDAAFRANKWTEAIEFYTQAIDASPTLKTSAALHCNRAACYTNLCEFDLAIFDGQAALRLDPTFSKGEMRQAEAFIRAHVFWRATESYKNAIALAETPAIKERYIKASKQVDILAAVIPYDPRKGGEQSSDIPRLRTKLLEEKGLVLDLSNAKGIFCTAYDYRKNAFDLLNAMPMGEMIVDDRIFDGLLSCIEIDHYAYMLPGALGTKLINYLQLCFQDAKVTQFLSTESDTLAAMKSFDREVKLNGNWDRTRYRMRTLIGGLAIAAATQLCTGVFPEALESITQVSALVHAAAKVWPYWGEDEADMGSIFSSKSRRSFDVVSLAIYEANYAASVRSKTIKLGSTDTPQLEKALRLRAKGIISNCEAIPESQRTLSYYDRPLADAYNTLGHITIKQASVRGKKHGSGVYYHSELAAEAAQHYQNAIKYLPSDSFLLAQAMYDEAEANLRVGGMKVGEFYSKIAAAERAFLAADIWAGSCPRNFTTHDMIRNLRTHIRNAISTQLNGASPSARPAGFRFMLNQTIKGVPTVARTDRLFKTKEAGTDMKFRSKQVGDLTLMDIVEYWIPEGNW